jgi:FkbM family methyltransferase
LPLAAFVDRHVPLHATALDIGANIGLSVILLARKVAQVIAYEPSPTNLKHLRNNLALNGVTNVKVIGAAVSAEPGELRFHLARMGAGLHVVALGHVDKGHISTVAVPAIRLDDEALPPISFMKIDVEGHEPDVLAGARALLARDRPWIFSEINVWCLCAFAGHSPGAYVRTLWDAFEVWEAGPDGTLTSLPDAYSFLYNTIIFRQGLADIVLRPREGHPMPTLPELSWPLPAVLATRPDPPEAE